MTTSFVSAGRGLSLRSSCIFPVHLQRNKRIFLKRYRNQFFVAATSSHAVPFSTRPNIIATLPKTPDVMKFTTVLPYLTRLVLADPRQYWRAFAAASLIILSKTTGDQEESVPSLVCVQVLQVLTS